MLGDILQDIKYAEDEAVKIIETANKKAAKIGSDADLEIAKLNENTDKEIAKLISKAPVPHNEETPIQSIEIKVNPDKIIKAVDFVVAEFKTRFPK